jgi:hypothetical protein
MKNPQMLFRVFILLCIVWLGCKKTDTPDVNKTYTPELVTASISGRVTDDQNKPLSGALVKAGSVSATTDIDGAFTVSNVTIDKNAAFIKVEKDGFFLGTKTLVAIANKNNQVAVTLIRKITAGSFTGSGGGAITVPSNGGSIAFEANSVVNPANNSSYAGAVTVHAFFINPEAANFNDIIPGALRGITTANQETGLQSFGMMAVELSGSAGEKLQLAPGKSATLRFPIPASLQNEAPAAIPLWSLDETTGLWKQEGSATRQGTEYIGNVSHFSFWNCDAPFPIVDFSGIIKNQEGSNIAGAEVVILVPPDNTTAGRLSGSGITNADGVFAGKLPANKTLQLKVYDKCHTLLLTKNIGPFSTTADLGVITVNSTPSQVTFSGTVKNCFNDAVTNGFVTVKLDGAYFNIPIVNGSFTTTITRCINSPATAALIAFDVTKQETTPEISIPVSGNTVNTGILVACGKTSDTYLRYSLDGISYELLPPADTLRLYYQATPNKDVSSVEATRQGQQNPDIVFFFSGAQAPGIHPVEIIEVLHGDTTTLYYHNGKMNADITEYGNAPGGYVSGTFSGTARNREGTKIVPISCSFRIKRND